MKRSRGKKSKTAAAAVSETRLAQLAVVRAPRLTLESAIVALVEEGRVSYSELERLGLVQAPAPKVSVVTTALLTSTGGMGAWERLDGVTILNVIANCNTDVVFTLSEVCKGLCAMRRNPRAWSRLDTGCLPGLTRAGLCRLSSSVPTSRLETLRLAPPSYKDSFTASDWIAFVKALDCGSSLKHLHLKSKKFGGGAQTLKALEPLVANVESLVMTEFKEKNADGLFKLLKAMPKLTDLELGCPDITYQYFLWRLSQLPALQRGPGPPHPALPPLGQEALGNACPP